MTDQERRTARRHKLEKEKALEGPYGAAVRFRGKPCGACPSTHWMERCSPILGAVAKTPGVA